MARAEVGHGQDSGQGVLERAFLVLQALPHVRGPGQVRCLADATGIPYPSVYRLLAQLVDVGLVVRAEDGYGLGGGVLDLASAVEPVPGLRARAVAVMSSLREHTGATLSLVTRMGEHTIILDVLPGREGLPYPVSSGHRLRPDAAATLALQRHGRELHGPGVVVDDGGDLPGLTCYATNLHLPAGAQVALQLSASAERPAARFAALVNQAAERISAGLPAR